MTQKKTLKKVKSNVDKNPNHKKSKSKHITQKGGEGMNHKEIRSALGLPYLTSEKQRKNVNEVYPGMPEFPPPFLNDCVIS